MGSQCTSCLCKSIYRLTSAFLLTGGLWLVLASQVKDTLNIVSKGEKQEKYVHAQKRKKPREQMIPKEKPRAVNRSDQETEGSGKVCSSSVLFIIPFSYSPAAQPLTPHRAAGSPWRPSLSFPCGQRRPSRRRPERPLEVGEHRLNKRMHINQIFLKESYFFKRKIHQLKQLVTRMPLPWCLDSCAHIFT